MRTRWQTVSRLWEENKRPVNKLDLLGQLDYFGKLSAQLEWQHDPRGRPVRVVYTQAGESTGALLQGSEAIVESLLYWVACKDTQEAYYLLAIINSDALYKLVMPLMSKGQFGARHLHKHLWKLPIPEFDPSKPLHSALSEAGEAAAAGAAQQLERLRADRGHNVSVTIARRELRKWLRASAEGKAVENAVGRLLGSGSKRRDSE